jgi:hypothetical protein
MLAVTTGDGACVEKNSTQPTARVSILTANRMVRPCSGLASKRSLQGGIKDNEHAMSQKFRGAVAENRDRECKATASTKHRYGTCTFKP